MFNKNSLIMLSYSPRSPPFLAFNFLPYFIEIFFIIYWDLIFNRLNNWCKLFFCSPIRIYKVWGAFSFSPVLMKVCFMWFWWNLAIKIVGLSCYNPMDIFHISCIDWVSANRIPMALHFIEWIIDISNHWKSLLAKILLLKVWVHLGRIEISFLDLYNH